MNNRELQIRLSQLFGFLVYSFNECLSKAALDRLLVFEFSDSFDVAMHNSSHSHNPKLPLNHADCFVTLEVQLLLDLSFTLLLVDFIQLLACLILNLRHLVFWVVSKLNFSADNHGVNEFSESSSAEETLDHFRTPILLRLSDYSISACRHRSFWIWNNIRLFSIFPLGLVDSHGFHQIFSKDSNSNPSLDSDNCIESLLLRLNRPFC